MATLAHITDPHFGDACPRRLAAALEALEALRPDCVVLTGDVTQSGRRAEFAAAADWLDRLRARTGAALAGCPGNHDAPVYALHMRVMAPFARFGGLGLATRWSDPEGQVALATANTARGLSARADWSQGDWGRASVRDAVRDLAATHARVRVLALHHPPETPAGARVRSAPDRLERARGWFGASPPSLVLCGHLHGDFAFAASQMLGVQVHCAPSLSSSRGRGAGAGFALYRITQEGLRREVWRYRDGVFTLAHPPEISAPEPATAHAAGHSS